MSLQETKQDLNLVYISLRLPRYQIEAIENLALVRKLPGRRVQKSDAARELIDRGIKLTGGLI